MTSAISYHSIKERKNSKMLAFIVSITMWLVSMSLHAQKAIYNPSLDNKQQSVITISGFTAAGDLVKLKEALIEGLNAGLTINEIKEVLVQLYAYTGFPRSLNALHTLITVVKERKEKGIEDPNGKEPSPLPKDKSKLAFGTEMQTKLVGQPVKGEVYEFAPAIDQFLKEHLFGDIFGRDNLDWKTRELATIAALASLGGTENQLRSHFGVGMYNGLTAEQLIQLVSIIENKLGKEKGSVAYNVLRSVLPKTSSAQNLLPAPDLSTTAGTSIEAQVIFPKGEKITNNNFTGTAWLHQMVTTENNNDVQVGNVTFEPGARTKWHYHPAGQVLLATGGVGYYQEKGSPVRIIRKGDVVNCLPGVAHWHGASRDMEFIQVAITNAKKGPVVWLNPVTEAEYNSGSKD